MTEISQLNKLERRFELLSRNIPTIGKSGLANLGNTCYLNSTIQCLSHIPPIRWYFQSIFKDLSNAVKPDSNVLIPFQELIQDLWNRTDTIFPENFVRNAYTLSKDYHQDLQQDAQEFLRNLLNSLDTGIKSIIPGSSSIVADTFQGKLETKITCNTCKTETTKIDNFLDILLPLPKSKELPSLHKKSKLMMNAIDKKKYHKNSQKIWLKFKEFCQKGSSIIVSLYDCLIANFKSQEINDVNNLYYCEACQKKCPIEMSYKITEFPNVMAFSVKRFKYLHGSSKIGIHVQLPLTINMKTFGANDENADYSLIGIIQHKGSTGRGHYKAFCKNEEDGKWYIFNDKKVTECTIEDVLEAQAYIAFYLKNYDERAMLEKCEGNDKVFIPLEWVNKYQTMAIPRKIDFQAIACKHGNLSPLLKETSLFPISRAQFQTLQSQFGLEGSPFVSSEVCQLCSKEIDDFKIRIITEVKLAKNLKEDNSYEGPWHLVSNSWIDKWINFINWTPKCNFLTPELPGFIDNSSLFENGEIKKNLKYRKHYSALNQNLWREFNKIYGSAQVIFKTQKDIYSKDAYEIPEFSIESEINMNNN
ncbi:USP20_1 [Blepharisma stoltei]|uniref:Ubiquitin carboxyl-terminal hydrolase n=1 Tax=Blepharisma stoltei TaxID=1481888 RepID=A0AAU9K9L3_9CILI|nr:unnamed protein product [Blepharisma stoltei]